jgi:predicted transcriptional regulator
MSTTITIRADESLRRALKRKAMASGKTVSELVREILEEVLTDRPLRTRTGHLRGRLAMARETVDGWRKQLRQRNWRP